MKNLELLNVTAQIRLVFGGEGFMEEVSDMQGVWQGHQRRNSRARTDRISSVDMRVM